MYSYTYVSDGSAISTLAQEVMESAAVALDLETTGFDPHTSRIRLLSLNTGSRVYILDLFKLGDAILPLMAVLHNPDRAVQNRPVVVGQNLKFDLKFLYHAFKVVLYPLFDCYRASSLLYNGKKERPPTKGLFKDYHSYGIVDVEESEGIPYYRHDLYSIYRREIHFTPKAYDLGGNGWWQPELSEEQLDYAAEDVTFLLKLRTILREKLLKAGLREVAELEMRVTQAEALMELKGIKLHKDRWEKLAEYSRAEAARVEEGILQHFPSKSLFGSYVNLGSPDQLLSALRRIGVKLEDTRNETLVLNSDQYPLLKQIVEYRKFSKRAESFGEDFFKFVNPVTGRIHASYFPFTGAGRYACSKPNLQQIPREKEYRLCFVPEEGKVYIVADYSQIELRIMAQLSLDPILLQVFRDGIDPHTATASIVSGVPIGEVTKVLRNMAKPVNFGLIYGIQPKKLLTYAKVNYGVEMNLEQATEFRDRFFESYREIQRWHEYIFDQVRPTGSVRTLAGRIRYLDPEEDYNNWLNTPDQGCLQPHVRVLTNRGYEPIQGLFGAQDVEGFDRKVWTGDKWAPFTVRNMGKCSLANITTSDGLVLDCDTRHKVLRVTEEGYEWAEYASLNVGDRLAMSLASIKEFEECPQEELSKSSKSKLDIVEPALDEDFFYWIGRYYGDGWKDSERGSLYYCFGLHEKEEAIKCAEYWNRFGVRSKVSEKTHTPHSIPSTRITVEWWSVDLVRWLTSLGILDATAHTKRLPQFVLSASVRNRKSFVKGFLDSDGHNQNPKKGNPFLHLCQKPLLQDFKLLLRTLGVESSIRGPYEKHGYTSFTLTIFNRMLRELFEEGPDVWPRMNMPAPKFLIEEFAKAAPTQRSAYPTESSYVLARRLIKGSNVSVYTLERLCKLLGVVLSSPIYAYRKVVSLHVSDTVADTFTLAVDDEGHRFDSEGLISKNTGADGLKQSLGILEKRLLPWANKIELVHQVHDEIVLEVDDDPDTIAEGKHLLETSMVEGISRYLPDVSVIAEAAHGKSWAEAKP